MGQDVRAQSGAALDAGATDRVDASSDGGWFAVVLIRAGSANNQSAVTMQLWLDPEAITTDLRIGR